MAQYRQQVLVAFQDVENALADLRTLAAQTEQQNQAVDASRRTLQLSPRINIATGAVTFLDVTDAERTVFNSERTSAQLLGQRHGSHRATHQGARRRVGLSGPG